MLAQITATDVGIVFLDTVYNHAEHWETISSSAALYADVSICTQLPSIVTQLPKHVQKTLETTSDSENGRSVDTDRERDEEKG